MPIIDHPFMSFDGHIYRPYLKIRIINSHTGKDLKTYGIVDTGADECAIPASFAPILGHELQAGVTKQIMTGNGSTIAYSHTTQFEIFHPESDQVLYAMPETPIDFMPNLHVVLLGVNSFLNKFVLKIDYPKKDFSIIYP
jgi:hypothetical protein